MVFNNINKPINVKSYNLTNVTMIEPTHLTHKSFNSMPLSSRLSVLNDAGSLVTARTKGTTLIYLYKVSNFFVELWHHYSHGNKHLMNVVSYSEPINRHMYRSDLADWQSAAV